MDDVELTEEELEAKKQERKKEQIPPTLPSEFEPLWKNVNDDVGQQALKYLLSRGVTHEQIKEHRIGFCGVGKYSWRIIFPVFTRKKALVGLVTRTFAKDVDPKYLNSSGTKTLYGARLNRRPSAILLEGVFDQLAVERAETKHEALGRLGSSLTDQQVKMLSKYKEIILWPDPDKAGVEGMIKTVKRLHEENIRKISIVPPLKDAAYDQDPGAIGKDDHGLCEIRVRIKKRVKWSKDVEDMCLARVLFMG